MLLWLAIHHQMLGLSYEFYLPYKADRKRGKKERTEKLFYYKIQHVHATVKDKLIEGNVSKEV